MLPLQTTISLPGRLLLGAAAGLLATLVMDMAMRRLPEGTTSPYVAAGTLTDTSLATASHRLAMVVHYGAGTGSGLLLVSLALVVQSLVDLSPLVSFVVAAVVQLPVMIAFFSYFVLPTYGRVPSERVARVRRDWALSATVYIIVVTALVAAPILVA
jgi:hypothetical protein